MRSGRLALLLVGTVYAIGLGWSALVLPARVPSHFDGAGRVDEWSSRTSFLVVWVVVGLVVLVGVPALTRFATAGDGSMVNLPERTKDYWFAPERRDAFRTRFQDDLEGFAAITGVLLITILALTAWVGATGRDAVPWWTFVVVVGAYLVLTAVWVVRQLRAYRPPASP